jgi:GTP-binding protein LepA
MRTSNLVKVDILLNATVVDALSLLIHVDNAHIGKKWKTKRINSRQQFDIPIQAAIVKVISWNYKSIA